MGWGFLVVPIEAMAWLPGGTALKKACTAHTWFSLYFMPVCCKKKQGLKIITLISEHVKSHN